MTKRRFKIVLTSCVCGGRWAWLEQHPSGGWSMSGCVCHHPWTLALRVRN